MHFVVALALAAVRSRILDYFVVEPQIDEIVVAARDYGRGAMRAARDFGFDVEFFFDILFEIDRDPLFGYIFFTLLDGLRVGIFQHFESVFRASDQGPEGHGDRQSDHPGPGNPDAHGVFEDVGAQAHDDPFGLSAQRFRGARRAQRHGDRFGAPDGGHHFAVDEVDDSATFG